MITKKLKKLFKTRPVLASILGVVVLKTLVISLRIGSLQGNLPTVLGVLALIVGVLMVVEFKGSQIVKEVKKYKAKIIKK